jgi:3-hydroxyisobutyrate dehydrogenase-like beta-hydroxyacid dehydrogenase
MARVGFCGLGVMGYPMAGHLVRAGHDVVVFNRTSTRALQWVAEHGARALPTPKEVANESDVVFICVGNDDDVRQVMLCDEGILEGAQQGLHVVDHTTTSAQLARDMFESASAFGVTYVDAPVSGGQKGAESATLSVMCGSIDQSSFNKVSVIIEAYARSCVRMGGVGCGQLTKMVNQICIAGVLEGLSEAMTFARNCGLDLHTVVDVIAQGAAHSWQLENRGHTMVDGKFDFGFAVEWMVKDLQYCIEEAHRVGSGVPMTEMVAKMYADLVNRGDGRLDTSSLIRALDNNQ